MKSISKQSTRKGCMTCGQEFADASEKCPFDGTQLANLTNELAPGEILGGRYEIIGSVAAGGMGQIYKAKHQLMNRTVAIKTIHLSLMSGGALKRFQQEAQAISALNHPNILSVFDFFISDEGQPYLVMDFLQGTNLRELLKAEKRLDLARALPILIDACSGFTHAHEHGVIHRDIKPANLMLIDFNGNSDFVKIVDFGIAKVATDTGESMHLTATGDTFGSPEFMSPEQCRAKKPDARSDIYSLGCVMYKMLTGVSLFNSQDPMEIMYKQVHDSPPPPSQICPEANLNETVDAVVLKAIQKEPENRFQTMEEMRHALQSISVPNTIPSSGTAVIDKSTSEDVDKTVVTKPLTVSFEDKAAEAKATTGAIEEATKTETKEATEQTATESVAVKNQSLAAKAAIGVAILASIIIAAGALRQSHNAPGTTAAISTNSDVSQPAQTTAPTTAAPVVSGASVPAGATAPAAVPGPQTTQSHSAAPLIDQNPQIQAMKLAGTTYESNFKNGQKELKAHHYPEARIYFQTAHNAASSFGQHDARYVDSLYWVAKCDLSRGQYQQAASELEWALYAQRALHGAKSAAVRATEKDLQTAHRFLKK